MAILRGGKRIMGMDIRLGIPRDRSMDNINRDPRFKQRAGANPATTIGRYQSYVNEAEGFARKARFYVVFELPRANFEEDESSSGMINQAKLSKFSKESAI